MARIPIHKVRNVHSSTNITTSAFTTLVPTIAEPCTMAEIYDTSGEEFFLAIGPAGSEVLLINCPRGGNGKIGLLLHQGMRLSAKALTANMTINTLIINLYK